MFSKFLSACFALALVACASNPATPTAQSPAVAANAQPPVGCVNGTGTRLPMKPTACAGFGNTYGQTQLDQTGRPYLQDSLQMLDSTVRGTGSVQ
jgi:hypothetical protein